MGWGDARSARTIAMRPAELPGRRLHMALKTVKVPQEIEPIFAKAEAVVSS